MDKKIEDLLRGVTKVLHIVTGVFMAAGTVMTFVMTVLRYGFHTNYIWYDEAVRMLLLTSAFWLAGYMSVSGGMVSFTVVSEAIKSPRVHKVFDMITAVVTLLVGIGMTKWTWTIFQNVKGQYTISSVFPKQMQYGILLVGMILLVIYMALDIIRKCLEFKNPQTSETGEEEK